METTEHAMTSTTPRVATPIKLVLIGAVLALLEGAFDVYSAELYTGVFDGVEVTTTDVLLFTGIGMAFVVATLLYAFAVRFEPTEGAYLVLSGLGVLTLVVGVLFTAAIVVLGGLLGYWESRRSTIDAGTPQGGQVG